MIKKILAFFVAGCFSVANAQNIELRMHNGASTLINGTTITVIDTVGISNSQDVAVEIDAKSTYSSSKTIKVKKIEKTSSAPLSENAICWGTCTLGVVWGTAPIVISDQVPMTASQTILYSGHVYPKLQGGTSCFRYIFFDVANTNDSTWVDVCFRVVGFSSLSEIKKNTSLKVYPNPASDLVNLNIESTVAEKTVMITDMLGRKVYTKNINQNNNNLAVNTSEFKPGIYFVSVSSGNNILKTEKLVITQ